MMYLEHEVNFRGAMVTGVSNSLICVHEAWGRDGGSASCLLNCLGV